MAEEKEPTRTATANGKTVDLAALKKMTIADLNAFARDMNVNGVSGLKKQDLIFKLLQVQAEREGNMFGAGVL